MRGMGLVSSELQHLVLVFSDNPQPQQLQEHDFFCFCPYLDTAFRDVLHNNGLQFSFSNQQSCTFVVLSSVLFTLPSKLPIVSVCCQRVVVCKMCAEVGLNQYTVPSLLSLW